MAVIKFSPNFLAGSTTSLQARVTNFTSNVYESQFTTYGGPEWGYLMRGGTSYNVFYATNDNLSILYIMSGVRPLITSLTSVPPAGTTILWQLDFRTKSNWAPTGNNWYTDPTIISSVFTQAAATGVATWFWIVTIATSGGTPIYTSVIHNVTGSIGELGSGSDLEMLSTNINAGQYIRVLNLNMKMPPTLF